ncbi:AsmA-like C-terminal region [Flavobacteriaceae bacterium MAR_2010_188]|nr:AsmA-like C-terminal region [Flavobacteriaceae bacterium MAR_2010_188]
MKTPTSKKKKSKYPRWLRRLGPVLGLIVIVPVGLFILGWQNRDLLIDGLQQWYKSNHNGVLEIGRVEANFLTGFPDVNFTINDIHQSEKDSISFKKDSIFIDKANVSISAADLLRGDIRFKKITINRAEIFSEVASNKSYDYHVQLKLNKPKSDKPPFVFPTWLNPNRTKFRIKDLQYIAKDSILYKDFNFTFHAINGEIKRKKSLVNGSVSFDASVNKLGFNTRKGSYLKETEVNGKTTFTLDIDKNILDIPEFLLNIDEEEFLVNASFDLLAPAYHFGLVNESLDFEALRKFLSDSLAKKIDPFAVLHPFNASVSIDGKFQFRSMPVLNAEFYSLDNEVIYENSYTLRHADFNGYVTNNLYESDSLKEAKSSSKDIKIFFTEVTGELDGMQVNAKDTYYQSTPENLNFIAADLNINGVNESLARVLKNDNFDFRGGSFKLNAKVRGDIDHPYRLFNYAEGNFQLKNTRVVLKKNGLQLPVETISLRLDNETSILEELSINLPQGENLVFKGVLENASSLISNDPLEPTTSFVQLDASSLNMDELISTAKEMIPKSDKKMDDRKTLNETIHAVFSKFRPRFIVNLGALEYNNIEIENLEADVALSGPETIAINNLSFAYQDSETDLKGTFVVPQTDLSTNQPMFMNVKANSNGPLAIFRDLFNIKLVNIEDGDYDFSGNFTGNIQKFEQLLDNAQGDLKLKNAKFYYPNAGLDLAFDSLSVRVANSDIILEQVEMEVGELYPFILNGNIKEFPNILLDNQGEKGSVFLNINAPYIDADEWMKVLNSLGKDEPDEPVVTEKKRELSKAFKDINRLQPEIKLSIDSLKYNDMITKEVDALAYFENDSVLKLDHLNIKYKNSEAKLGGTIHSLTRDTTNAESNPFDFRFSANVTGKTEDLNDYLKTINFIFESGRFEFNGTYAGEASDLAIFNSDAKGSLKLANSKVNFMVANIQIPIDSLRLEINNDFASLETLKVNLPGKSSVSLSGSIDNFSDFINNSVENVEHISTFNINSSYLDTKDILNFLSGNEEKKDSSAQKPLKVKKIKEVLNTINDSYYPLIRVRIDSLIHQDLAISDFSTDIGFDNTANLKIEETTIDFYEGTLSFEILANTSENKDLPVAIIMKGNKLNLKKLVEGLKYFGDEDLENTDKIEGLLNFTLNANGILNDDGTINMESLDGDFYLNLEDLALHNYEPLMESVVLLKKDRFKNLEFRPIKQTFKILDGEIIIPRTEIQSSAIHVFAEGKLKLNEYIDIWLSVPWKNLKANDGLTLPEKKSFEHSGSKFYINLVQDQNSEVARKQKLRFKIRLGNRKLRKSPKF